VETYDEARMLSAKQRAGIPSKKYPSSDNIYSHRFVCLWCEMLFVTLDS